MAGRDDLCRHVQIALERTRLCRPAKSLLMVGLRGVGKTVLLSRMRDDAERAGIHTLYMEAPEDRSLPSILAPRLRQALLRLSRIEKVRDLANRSLRALAGFVNALKMKFTDLEVTLDLEPEPGLADNGILEDDLQALLEIVGKACRKADVALVLFLDEMQYVPEEQLAALVTSLHRCAQQSLPVCLVGAGLPQLRGRMGQAKSYAERLFDFPKVGPLSPEDARYAIEQPARENLVAFREEAIERIVGQTEGYPYFLQEWGKHVWDVASQSPITLEDVQEASRLALADLDQSFFRVRFDRLTPTQKQYLRAMAQLGPGSHRSGDIADVLDRKVTSLGPIRSHLIAKGMIWSPSHGDTAFTVPLFDGFLRRIMPGDDWR